MCLRQRIDDASLNQGQVPTSPCLAPNDNAVAQEFGRSDEACVIVSSSLCFSAEWVGLSYLEHHARRQREGRERPWLCECVRDEKSCVSKQISARRSEPNASHAIAKPRSLVAI